MSTIFYRLEYPDPDDYYSSAYSGTIPELPTDYAWMNNDPIGGSRASFDGEQSGGHSEDGSFFVCNRNDALHTIANRPHQAASTNTDLLDDFLRRPIAVPTWLDDSTAGVPLITKTIPIGEMVWLGPGGTEYASLFQIVDSDGNEIIDAAGATCVVTATNPLPGDVTLVNGFASTAVQLTITPGIPATTTYRIYYAKKGSLAELPRDAITSLAIRGVAEIDGGVRKQIKDLHGGSADWNDSWQATVYDLARSGLRERNNRSTTVTLTGNPEPEMGWDFDTYGSGSWIRRDGYAPAVYQSTTAGIDWKDPIDGSWKAIMREDSKSGYTTKQATGFVYYGGDYCKGYVTASHDYVPTVASILHLGANKQGGLAGDFASAYTYLPYDCACSVGYSVLDSELYISVSAPYFFHDGANTDIQSWFDVIEFYDTASHIRRSFLVLKLKTSTSAYLRKLDGSKPGDLGALTGTLRWHPTKFCISDGASEVSYYEGTVLGADLQGLTFMGTRQHGTMVGPGQGADGADGHYGHAARFYSGSSANLEDTPVIMWGHKNSTVDIAGITHPTTTGHMYADGSIVTVANIDIGGILAVGGYSVFTGDIYCDEFLARVAAQITFVDDAVFNGAMEVEGDLLVSDLLKWEQQVAQNVVLGAVGLVPVAVNLSGGIVYLNIDKQVDIAHTIRLEITDNQVVAGATYNVFVYHSTSAGTQTQSTGFYLGSNDTNVLKVHPNASSAGGAMFDSQGNPALIPAAGGAVDIHVMWIKLHCFSRSGVKYLMWEPAVFYEEQV
jgi:hypothetical protein